VGARRRGVKLAGAAVSAVALVLVIGGGVDVGAGIRRPASTPPSAITMDNPITGASVPDAVYHGTSAPNAIVIGTRAASGDRFGTANWVAPGEVVLSM
jgi:hypothetical protein